METSLYDPSKRTAARSYTWEAQARINITVFHLQQRRYRQALNEMRYLYLLRRQPGFAHQEFATLARRTLIGLGRMQDADCFAALSKTFYDKSRQAYCAQLRL